MKKTLLPRLLATSAAALALLAAHSAFAVDYTWNATATTGNWTAGGSWVGGTAPTTTSDNATFASGVGTVNQTANLTAATSIGGIVFSNNGTTKINTDGTTRALTLGASGITINSGSGAVSFGGTTAGGAVTFVLAADQTWTNNSSNTFFLQSRNAINNGGFGLTIAGTGSLTQNAATTNLITGTGSLTKNGSGTLTLTSNNTFSGVTLVNAGTLSLNGTRALSNSILDTGGAGTITTNGTTLELGGLKGSVNLGTGSVLATGYSGITALTFNTTVSNNGSYSGVIANGAAGMTLTKIGAGTQILSGANSYTGGTVVQAGTLVITGSGTLGATTGNLSVGTTAAGGTGNLDLGGTSQTVGLVTFNGTGTTSNGTLTGTAYEGLNGTVTAVLAGSGVVLTKNGTGTVTLNATNTYSGGTVINSGVLQVGNGGTSGALSSSGVITNNGTIIFNRSDAITQGSEFSSSAILGTGTLTKNGSGTLTLNAANSYTGGTVLNNGTVLLSGSGTLGASTGGITVQSVGSLNLGGTSQTVGYVTFNGSGTTSNGTLTGTAYEGLNGTVTAVLAGSGVVLTKNGTGTLTLNATNTYSGGTVLNNGTLNIQKDNALGNGTITINGGAFSNTDSTTKYTLTNNNSITINGNFGFNGTSASGSLDLGAGDVSLGTAAGTNRTITVSNTTLFIGGNITNGTTATQIVKAGNGTLDLSGNSTAAPISGGLVIKQGTVNLGFGNNAAGGNVVNGVGNGTIVLGDAAGGDARLSTGSFTIANDILLGTGAVGNLTIGSTGATRSSIYTGNVTMNGDNLTILNAGSSTNHRFTGNFLGAGNLTINNTATGAQGVVTMNGTINNTGSININNVTANGSTVISGNIGSNVGDVILTASGAGTTTLNGTNSYTGNTTIGTTGTLKFASGASLGNGAQVTINQNGNLLATGDTTTNKNIIFVGASATVGAAAGKTLTINGTASGPANVGGTNGSGTVVFNAANQFTSGSVMLVNGGGSVSMGNAMSLNGTTLKYNGGSNLDNTGTGANAFTTPVGMQGLVLTSGFTFIGTNNLDLSAIETAFIQTAGGSRTINVNANTLTMNGIQGSGNTLVNSASVTVEGALVKGGSGTLVLAGNSSYSLGTTVNAGTLKTTGVLNNFKSSNIGINENINTVVVNGGTAASTLDLSGITATNAITLNGSTNGASLINSNTGTATNIGTGSLSSLTFTNGGGNFTLSNAGAALTVSSGNATASIAALGANLGTVNYLGLGSGWNANNTITLSGGGSTANATYKVTGVSGANGTITSLSLTSAGSGFTSTPTISTNGTGTGLTLNDNYTVVSMNATAGGGYSSAPTVTSPFGTGFAATTSLASVSLVGTNNNIGGNGNINLNAVVSGGGGGFNKIGTGTLVLSGANTYNGSTTVNDGKLVVSGAGTLGATTANLTVTGGTMDLGGTSQTQNTVTFAGGTTQNGTLTATSIFAAQSGTVSANLTGSGSATFVKTTAGLLTLSGNSTVSTGTTFVNGGVMALTGGSYNTSTQATNIGNAGVSTGILYATGGNFTTNNFNVGGAGTSFGSLVINGGSVTTTTATVGSGLTGSAGYGGFFMSNGSFSTRRYDLGSTSVAATSINVAQITGGNWTNSDYILLRGGRSEFTVTGGTVNHSGAAQNIAIDGATGSVSSTFTVAGGSIDNTGSSVQFGRVTNTSNATLNLNAGTLLTGSISATAGNIAGSANVNFNGGTLKASAASTTFLPVGISNAYVNGAFGTYAGGAVIDTNTFDLTFAKGLLAPTGNGLSGLTLGSAGSGYMGAPIVEITGGGGTGATGYAVVDLNPSSGTFGQVTGVVLTNPGVGYTSAPTINLLGGNGSGASASSSGLVANTSGGLVKNGTGTLTLSVNGTYSGGTIINAGSVQATARNAMGTGVVTVTGTGTFQYNTDAFIEGFVANKAGGTSLFNNQPTTQYLTIGASGIVNNPGAGQLTIGNTSNRPVSVVLGSSQTWTNNGTKILMNGNGTVNTLDLAANTLTLNGTGSGGYQFDAPIIGTGNIVKNSTGNLTVTNANTYNGTTTINAGTLNVGNGADAGSIANTSAITNNGSLVYNVGAGVRTLAAPISGTGSLTQASSGGSLTLTGNNTYTGATVISAGTLQIGAGTDAGSIASTSSITNNGSLVYNVGSGVRTLAAPISGTGSLTQNSSGGSLTLSNTNTYSGSTLVTAGTLVVSGTINNTSGVQVDGGTFNYTGATALSRNVVVNNGGTFRYNSAAAMTSVITLNSGATLGGSGSVGAISGAGSVDPGNSPGILTATTADFSGGLGFKFEFGATGNPTWSNASSSVNDVLHLTNTSTPFLNSATASNVFDIYFGVASISGGNSFNGGFFAGTADFSSSVANGTYNYYVLGNGSGSHAYNGTNYYTLAEYNAGASTSWTIAHGTFAVNGANFADGTVNGYVQQFNVVPEPAAWILAAFGLTTAVVFRRRRRD